MGRRRLTTTAPRPAEPAHKEGGAALAIIRGDSLQDFPIARPPDLFNGTGAMI